MSGSVQSQLKKELISGISG